MSKEWITGTEGINLKFERETLLNYGMNRWGLNKAYSVGPTSELIRQCAPGSFEEWEEFYFRNATQKRREGVKITREYIRDLGQKLYIKLSKVVQSESVGRSFTSTQFLLVMLFLFSFSIIVVYSFSFMRQ
jgi:hypothetical protein